MNSKFNFNIAQPANAPFFPYSTGGSTAPVADASTLSKVLDILGSKGGQTAVGAVGAGLQAYQQSKDAAANRAEAQANRQQTAAQFAANMLQRQAEDDRNYQLEQSKSVAALSPIGESQKFAQRNAILHPLLAGARNFSVAPGDADVAAAMGAGPQGGMRLPEGGLDAGMLERMFGEASTLESIKNRQQQLGQINPNMKTMDLSSMYGDSGATATSNIMADNSALAEQQQEAQFRQRDQIMRAIDEDIRGEKRGGPAPEGYEYDKKTGQLKKKGGGIGGFFKGLGKIALTAAPIVAAPFTGGTSLALLSAGAGAANAALSGGGLKGALLGGALGGATAGLGGGAGAKATTLGAGLKQAVKNPALYSAILGR